MIFTHFVLFVCLSGRVIQNIIIAPIYVIVLHKKCYTHASVSSKMIGIGIGIRTRDVFRIIHHWEIGRKYATTSFSSSRSISSAGRRCPNVSAKLMPVIRHAACCCHRTKRMMYFSHLCLGFPLLRFPCIIVFSKPLWRVTWRTYLS